jgi:hypothetical protein
MDIHSVCWLIIAVTVFILGLFFDKELREEMNARNVSIMLFTIVAIYFAILWIAEEWQRWCL